MTHDLRLIPFFSELDDDILAAIQRRCFRASYPKGEIIFEEKEPGDRMYLIESGQIKIYSDRNGTEKIYSYLGPGSFFGETALLTGEPRNASVRVVIDADLLVLSKRDFEELLRQFPALGLELSRELGRRLTRTQNQSTETTGYHLVAVFGPRAVELARALAMLTGEEVFLFDLGGLRQTPVDASALAQGNVLLARGDTVDETDLAERLGTLTQEYFWVLLSLPGDKAPLTHKALDLADVTIQVSNEVVDWLKPNGNSKNLWRVPFTATSMARTARRLAGRQVGLALSSGNARGFAHIGVLRALEKEGIPVDLIAATSMGALFGSLYAAGRSIDEIIEFALHIQKQASPIKSWRMWDFGIPPRSGLLRGRATLEYIRGWLQSRTFADLEIPLRIVATDVVTGEEVVFQTGQVAEAVRSSISLIGIFEPASVGSRFLVDGGAVNPVPTSILADEGMNIIVASSVIPGLEDRLPRKQLRARGKPPNVLGIVMGTMEIMESEIIRTRLGGVHVLIQPAVARYTTLDYDKVHEIIEAGEAAARREIPRLRQLFAPRPRRR